MLNKKLEILQKLDNGESASPDAEYVLNKGNTISHSAALQSVETLLDYMGQRGFDYDCPFPTKEQIPNGRYFYRAPEHTNWKMAPENYPLRFRCSRGFVKKGAATIVCRDSRWTRSIPKCLAMKCTDPPALLNGNYTLDNGENHPLTIGTKVIYTCDPGYHLHNFADSVT
ncbi:hypothetical protein AVEN_104709-1 [Araneus ventricosus]|uniref:Sushi domain-containing protein n=1 Tax=Araneus ventricosus TaxID=182803 RepID=A0A4Y2SQZ8_ARAVE|nr:hypothetical protein AVEN_99140-1 [Araneus ventricosus]GBN90637.1 hypothetical protein AVEN_104709-1 [Araneus ventricosus]